MDRTDARDERQQQAEMRGVSRRGLLLGAASAGALAAPLLRSARAQADGVNPLALTGGTLRQESGTVSGRWAQGFKRVRDEFVRNFAERGEVGASVCVILGGIPVVDLWGGTADPTTGARWQPDTLVHVWS